MMKLFRPTLGSNFQFDSTYGSKKKNFKIHKGHNPTVLIAHLIKKFVRPKFMWLIHYLRLIPSLAKLHCELAHLG